MSVIAQDHPIEASEQLLAQLKVIDLCGWDSDQGCELLMHVRSHIVRPQVLASGLRGPAAVQAEATAWEVAWEVLNKSRLREAESPWGVLWVAVRRAVQGEIIAATYQTSERKSWRAHRLEATETAPPISLTRLVENGWEPPQPAATVVRIGPGLQAVVAALVQVGWERRTAHAVVEGVAAGVVRDGNRAGIRGWRDLASRLNLPPWQVRRVAALLLGGPGWTGLVERMEGRGTEVLEDDDMRAALRATANKKMATPVLAGRMVAARNSIRVAS